MKIICYTNEGDKGARPDRVSNPGPLIVEACLITTILFQPAIKYDIN